MKGVPTRHLKIIIWANWGVKLVRVHKSTRSTALQQMFSVIRNGQVELFLVGSDEGLGSGQLTDVGKRGPTEIIFLGGSDRNNLVIFGFQSK
jgi:hypothetical protein